MTLFDVRPAAVADYDAIITLCSRVLENDYIPDVLDEWLHNPNSTLLVAVTAEQSIVGIMHFNVLTPIDGWLEGIRVDPDFRRRGIARLLHQQATLTAMQQGIEYLRLTTETTNEAAIALVKSLFMRQVGGFAFYQGTIEQPARQESLQIATDDDLDLIIDYLNHSNIFPLAGGLYYHNYSAVPITATLLEEMIAEQQIYLLKRWDRLEGLALLKPDKDNPTTIELGYIDGNAIEAISLIAYELQKLPAMQRYQQIRAYAPDIILVHDALQGIGYQSRQTAFYTFERSLIP